MLVIGENRSEKKKKISPMYPSIGLGSQQVQLLDEGERIEGRTQSSMRTVVCGWGHWCLFPDECRHHRLISWMRELASSRHQFTLFPS